jgi:hypothetical protein
VDVDVDGAGEQQRVGVVDPAAARFPDAVDAAVAEREAGAGKGPVGAEYPT